MYNNIRKYIWCWSTDDTCYDRSNKSTSKTQFAHAQMCINVDFAGDCWLVRRFDCTVKKFILTLIKIWWLLTDYCHLLTFTQLAFIKRHFSSTLNPAFVSYNVLPYPKIFNMQHCFSCSYNCVDYRVAHKSSGRIRACSWSPCLYDCKIPLMKSVLLCMQGKTVV